MKTTAVNNYKIEKQCFNIYDWNALLTWDRVKWSIEFDIKIHSNRIWQSIMHTCSWESSHRKWNIQNGNGNGKSWSMFIRKPQICILRYITFIPYRHEEAVTSNLQPTWGIGQLIRLLNYRGRKGNARVDSPLRLHPKDRSFGRCIYSVMVFDLKILPIFIGKHIFRAALGVGYVWVSL